MPCREPHSRSSGAEEHEPEHGQNQYGKAGRDHEQSEHRRPRPGLPRFGRGFDDLTLLSRCHAGLDFLDVAPDFWREMPGQRVISVDVPAFAAICCRIA
jgi:hypothetical protein